MSFSYWTFIKRNKLSGMYWGCTATSTYYRRYQNGRLIEASGQIECQRSRSFDLRAVPMCEYVIPSSTVILDDEFMEQKRWTDRFRRYVHVHYGDLP